MLWAVVFLLFSSTTVLADNPSIWELSPVIKEGAPGSVLVEDLYVPAFSGNTQLNSGSGSIQNSLQNQMALPVTDYGKAGSAAQLRGFGFSAEDVDVQILGISANPPQGGGFDLSIFPQYLWSGYSYQLGPSLNALNPSASSGTLSLVPWTSDVLLGSKSDSRARATGFSSSSGVNQISAAASTAGSVALVAGYSSGLVSGPSMSLGSRWGGSSFDGEAGGGYTGFFYLLATDLDAVAPGPTYAPSPRARIQNTRMIPVIQNDFRVGRTGLFKSSLFYDGGWIGYQDPDSGSFSRDSVQQWGVENAYLTGQWKFGLNARQINYKTFSSYLDFQAPLQSVGNFQVAREFEIGAISLEPTIQGVWVTGYGLMPQGSLGMRRDWTEGKGRSQAVFGRASFSKKIPSILDRFALSADFVGNPNLTTETDWTAVLGAELKNRVFESTLQIFSQLKQNARVNVGNTVNNLNDAAVLALTGSGAVHLTKFWDVFQSTTISRSHLAVTGSEFPYIPPFLSLVGIDLHDLREKRRWEWSTVARFSSSQVTNPVTEDVLSGYMTLDTGLQLNVSDTFHLAGRIEDLFDQSIELVRGYPMGRTLSVMLVGEI